MKTYSQFFPAITSSIGSVLLIHGTGEHLDRYLWVIRKWNEAGFDVFGGDLPGFGRSEGKKGHISRFEDYVSVVEDWVNQIQQKSPHLPFIFGHSLGGLIVSRFMEIFQQKVRGVLLSSPCFALSTKIPFWKEALSKGLNVLYPSLVMPSGVKSTLVTRSQHIINRDNADLLITRGASVRWYRELVANMTKNRLEQCRFPNIPLLIFQAGQDLLIDANQVKKWFETVPVTDKIYREWSGLYHEILNEPEREEVFSAMLEWQRERTETIR